MSESSAVPRLCLVAGIEGYRQGDDRAQADLRRRFTDTLERTLRSAGVALDRTIRQERADGQLILLPMGVKAAAVVAPLIRGLLEHLDQDRSHALTIPLRLRVSMVPGIVTRARAGYAGRPVVMATRLADSPAARDVLDAHRMALFALIVSDDLYQDVFMRDKDETGAEGFRRVIIDMPDKEWREEAWVRGWEAGAAKPGGNRAVKALRNTVMPVIGTMPESVASVLENPEVDSQLSGAAHDAGGTHEEWLTVTESTAEEHATYYIDENGNLAEEYGSQADYTTVDYESFDSPADSHDELY